MLPLLALFIAAMSGCITDGDAGAQITDVAIDDDMSSPDDYGRVTWWWRLTAAGVLNIELNHPGGDLAGTLRLNEGALTSYRILVPENCEGGTGGGSVTSGGSVEHPIMCPDIQAGMHTIEIEMSGTAQGTITFEDVQPPASQNGP